MSDLVTLDCLVTWFPTTFDNPPWGPLLQAATFSHATDQLALAASARITHYLPKAEGDLFGPNCSVQIWVEDGLFQTEIRLELFGAERKVDLTLPPNAQVPFLLHVEQGQINNLEFQGTAAVFQGVFATNGGLSIRKAAAFFR